MNLPNILTVARILLAFVFLILISMPGLKFKILAAFVFAVAALTDFYDGYYAKKHQLESDFGKFMDPVADKFLILAAFFIFTKMHIVAVWMFMLIFFREALITVFRLLIMRRGEVLAAENLGKIKTVSQITAISFILALVAVQEFSYNYNIPYSLVRSFRCAIEVLMHACVILTVVSGIAYLWHNRRFVYGPAH